MEQARNAITHYTIIYSLLSFVSAGCTAVPSFTPDAGMSPYEQKQLKLRQEYGDPPPKGYQPLDPIPAVITHGPAAKDPATRNRLVLQALPNEAVRLAIGQADSLGNISFGPFTAKTKEGSYVVVLDYIKYQSRFLAVSVLDQLPESEQPQYYKTYASEDQARAGLVAYNQALANYKAKTPYWARNYELRSGNQKVPDSEGYVPMEMDMYNIPVYVGVGVRMVASVTVSDATVDLGSLYGLAAGAQSKKLQGTLVIQTLGLSGEGISPQIPLPAEINVTTIQNAIQALATIKSKIYDDKVWLAPAALAIDDYVGRPGSKEQIVSRLREENADAVRLTLPTL